MYSFYPKRGAVLMFSLILLAVMSGIGIATMSLSLTEQKMTTNLHDLQLANNSALAAIRAATEFLQSQKEIKSPTDIHLSSSGTTRASLIKRDAPISDALDGSYFPINAAQAKSNVATFDSTFKSLESAQIEWIEKNGVDLNSFAVNGNTRAIPTAAASKGVARQPKIFIKEHKTGSDQTKSTYMIKAVGYGKRDSIKKLVSREVTFKNARIIARFDPRVLIRVYDNNNSIASSTGSFGYGWISSNSEDGEYEFIVTNIEEGDQIRFIVSAPSSISPSTETPPNRNSPLLGMLGHIEWNGMIFPTNPVYFTNVRHVATPHSTEPVPKYVQFAGAGTNRHQDILIYDTNRWSSITPRRISKEAFWISNENWHLNYPVGSRIFSTYWVAEARKKTVHYGAFCGDSIPAGALSCEAGQLVQFEWASTSRNTWVCSCSSINYFGPGDAEESCTDDGNGTARVCSSTNNDFGNNYHYKLPHFSETAKHLQATNGLYCGTLHAENAFISLTAANTIGSNYHYHTVTSDEQAAQPATTTFMNNTAQNASPISLLWRSVSPPATQPPFMPTIGITGTPGRMVFNDAKLPFYIFYTCN